MQAIPRSTASGQPHRSNDTPLLTRALPDALLRDAPWTQPAAGTRRAEEENGPAALDESVAEGIGLAHDAGNLLGAIQLYCDLLALPGVLRAEHRHYAVELQQLSARGGSLLARLLRSEILPQPQNANVPSLPVETIILGQVVSECRGLLDAIACRGCLLMTMDAAAAAARVAVPREAVERILVNLTKNAAEASEGHGSGTITVRVRMSNAALVSPATSPNVTLFIQDAGKGMSEQAIHAALAGELENESSSIGGSGFRCGRGIGLRVVRELVARTGGELRIYSRLGRGTTVEICWPTREGSVQTRAETG